MSSAYRLVLCSLFLIVIPSILRLVLKAKVKNSVQRINRYGEMGSPFLQPLCRVKVLERWPFKMI